MSVYLIVEKSPLLEMAYEMGMERKTFLDDGEGPDDKKKSLEWAPLFGGKKPRILIDHRGNRSSWEMNPTRNK